MLSSVLSSLPKSVFKVTRQRGLGEFKKPLKVQFEDEGNFLRFLAIKQYGTLFLINSKELFFAPRKNELKRLILLSKKVFKDYLWFSFQKGKTWAE